MATPYRLTAVPAGAAIAPLPPHHPAHFVGHGSNAVWPGHRAIDTSLVEWAGVDLHDADHATDGPVLTPDELRYLPDDILDTTPDPLRGIILHARCRRCGDALVASAGLVAMSAVLMRRVVVRSPRDCSAHAAADSYEYAATQQYQGCIAHSGAGKSTVSQWLFQPLRDMVAQRVQLWRVRRQQAMLAGQEHQRLSRSDPASTPADIPGEDGSVVAGEPIPLQSHAERLAVLEAAAHAVAERSPECILGDATIEAAAESCATSDERLLLTDGEGSLWQIGAGRYGGGKSGKGPDPGAKTNYAFYCDAYDGIPHGRARVKDGTRISLQHPAIAIWSADQPTLVDTLRAHPDWLRMGIMGRFLLWAPAPAPDGRHIPRQAPPEQLLGRWKAHLLAWDSFLSAAAPDPDYAPLVWRMSSGAEQLWTEWLHTCDSAAAAALHWHYEWAVRAPGHALRLAAAHAAMSAAPRRNSRSGELELPPLGIESLRWAIRMVEHACRHMWAIYAPAGDAPVAGPEHVSGQIAELSEVEIARIADKAVTWLGTLPATEFSLSELTRHVCREAIRRPGVADAVLSLLFRRGVIFPASAEPVRGRKYHVHPDVRAAPAKPATPAKPAAKPAAPTTAKPPKHRVPQRRPRQRRKKAVAG